MKLWLRSLFCFDRGPRRFAAVLSSLAMLALNSCSSTAESEAPTLVAAQEGAPGGISVETSPVTATVVGINVAGRKITLRAPDGMKTTVKAGPQITGFEQIRIGDQVRATVTEEIVVYLAIKGTSPYGAGAALVALAPRGAMPGMFLADTAQYSVKIRKTDPKGHRVTLEFPDGATESLAVRKDIDLTRIKLGEEVVVRTAEPLALSLERF